MYHHDARDYKEAASAAAKQGREKMEQIIAKGRDNALAVMEQVQAQVPIDRIATAKALAIVPNNDLTFGMKIQGGESFRLHENAMTQVAEKTGLYKKFMDDLRDRNGKEQAEKGENNHWALELISHNINTLLKHSDDRHLIRAVEEKGETEIRGFLSDRFRRLDSRPLLDAFMGACKTLGMVPIDGYALDTRVRMRAVLPFVFEPVKNEVMLFGMQWGNSDFGNGGHTLGLFNTRVWCTNTAITDEVLRQVHLGKRLDDNILYSRKTYELDTKTNASAIADIVHNTMNPQAIENYLHHIKIAAEDTIGEKDVTRLLKQKLTKGDAEKVEELYLSPDVVNLPPGKTTYRLSNAVSFFAQNEKLTRNRRLDLESLAGELLGTLGTGKAMAV